MGYREPRVRLLDAEDGRGGERLQLQNPRIFPQFDENVPPKDGRRPKGEERSILRLLALSIPR